MPNEQKLLFKKKKICLSISEFRFQDFKIFRVCLEMPPPSKKQKTGKINYQKGRNKSLDTLLCDNNSNSSTCIQMNDLTVEDSNQSLEIRSNSKNTFDQEIQTTIDFRTIGTQTLDPYSRYKSSTEDFHFDMIKDLCCIFIDSLSSWNAINKRLHILLIILIRNNY